MVPPGPYGDDPSEGGAAPDDWPPAPRPYSARPFPGRPFPGRGYGEPAPDLRPFPGRPFPGRPFPGRPFPGRPFPGRPFPGRPFPGRPDGQAPPGAPDARLDPYEWTADVSELFLARSAVIGLGARVLVDEGRIDIPQVLGGDEPLAPPDYLERPKDLCPGDPEPVVQRRVEKPYARIALRALWPGRYELAWKVIVPDELAEDLAEEQETAWAVKDDVARALALRADTAFLQGDPFLGVEGVAAPAAAATAEAQARALLADVRARPGVTFDYAGWIFSAATLEQLTLAKQGDRTWDSTFLLTPDGADGGLLLGYPFIVSEAADDRIFLSADWSEAWIGFERRVVTVDVSTDAHFQSDETVIRAVTQHDLAIRRPELFAVGYVE